LIFIVSYDYKLSLGVIVMKRLSQEKMIETIKKLRRAKNFTQEQLSITTGINRQMIGRLENGEYMPSVLQLEKLSEILDFDITSLYVDSEPMVYTAFRGSNMSKDEKEGADHMFEMMMASKQQLLLRKAMLNG
jgi:transcriptional regulator with XRE-family HTH domain